MGIWAVHITASTTGLQWWIKSVSFLCSCSFEFVMPLPKCEREMLICSPNPRCFPSRHIVRLHSPVPLQLGGPYEWVLANGICADHLLQSLDPLQIYLHHPPCCLFFSCKLNLEVWGWKRVGKDLADRGATPKKSPSLWMTMRGRDDSHLKPTLDGDICKK